MKDFHAIDDVGVCDVIIQVCTVGKYHEADLAEFAAVGFRVLRRLEVLL